MARIVQVVQAGGPEHLRLAEVVPDAPAPGEIRLKTQAFALNRADLLYIHGDHYTELALPSRIGSEAAGVIDAVGDGVTGWKVGDRVCTVPFFSTMPQRHGVQGEFAIIPADYAAPWPEGLTAEQAASVWMQFLTAHYAMSTVGQLAAGKAALILAAASSAGQAAVQTARALGARVVATTRTAAKRDFLIASGAHEVILTGDDGNLAPAILSATDGRGVDVVFDPIAGTFIRRYADALARKARILVYGMLDGGTDIVVPILPLVRVEAVVAPYSMYNHVMNAAERAEGIAAVLDGLARGALRPQIDRSFPFDQTPAAYAHMLGNTQAGKIVVTLP